MMNQKLKLYLVDDHTLFREGLSFLLMNSGEYSSVFEADSAKVLLQNVLTFKPDIILMDIDMPVMNGIEASREVLKIYPEANIIALSMYADEWYYTEMIDAGAKGFLLKNSSFEEVKNAIKTVSEGNNYFSNEILSSIVMNLDKNRGRKKESQLSEREIEVLFNICKGFSNADIADKLFISKRTVDKHRENLLLKTDCRNTAELVVFAIRNKFFQL
jgi:DNA-binding NarL/FixJ family response regulator